ncbi:hypothetical protein L916_13595 [Phytophthora nicotianae]|uniref:Uncharacterized protein n=2 Tax=Phytophthora nicotianae TaxID=4792 RepID=W2IJ86_PHYNI|nr:hypothetical protein L916_13595 [Phytophthora nicotianae]ETO58475.1 hypothetical protein F444_23151 [Phytophthora nicotianae P1976]
MARGRKRVIDDGADGAFVAQSLLAKRTNTNAKRTYQSEIKGMTEWLAVHHPDTIDSSTKSIRVPLPKDAVLPFVGHICSPAHTYDLNSVHASDATHAPLNVSSIWGYRSALVDIYHATLDSQLDTELRGVRMATRRP